MIRPSPLRVTCDSALCDRTPVYVPLDWLSDRVENTLTVAIPHWLRVTQGWIVRDGQHFCSAGCAERIAAADEAVPGTPREHTRPPLSEGDGSTLKP